MEPLRMRHRARRSYELGRLRHAASVAWPVPALVLLSAVGQADAALHGAIGFALLAVAVWLPFRGGSAGRAVMPGLVVGLVPMLVPLVVVRLGVACFGAGCWSNACIAGCIAGGAGAGVALGLRAGQLDVERVQWLAAAATVASLTGALGCAFAGVLGLSGMIAALLLVSTPVAVVARAVQRA